MGLQLSNVGLVGRASNPSKLTVWCIYSDSGLSCRQAKCARLAQRNLALCRQQLPCLCEDSSWQYASIYPRIRSACPLARLRSTLTLALLPAVWSWCLACSDRATCRIWTVSSGPRSRAWRLLRAPASELAAWSLNMVPVSFKSQSCVHRGSAASESPRAFLAMDIRYLYSYAPPLGVSQANDEGGA